MRPALHAVPLALLGLAAALAAARRPTLLVLATHALTSLVAAWVHAEHQKPVLAALASTPVIAILVCVGLLRRSSNDDVFGEYARVDDVWRITAWPPQRVPLLSYPLLIPPRLPIPLHTPSIHALATDSQTNPQTRSVPLSRLVSAPPVS